MCRFLNWYVILVSLLDARGRGQCWRVPSAAAWPALIPYMLDVLQRISLHPARNIRGLIPRIWKEKFGANPLKSDLD